MRELTLNEMEQVEGGSLLGVIGAILTTPVSIPVAIVVGTAAVVIIGVAIANQN